MIYDISTDLFQWVLEIPSSVAQFTDWLTEPINDLYLPLSPLELLGLGGVTFIIVLIVIHVIKLFI